MAKKKTDLVNPKTIVSGEKSVETNTDISETKENVSEKKSKKKYIRNLLILSEVEKEMDNRIYTEVKTIDGKIFLLTTDDYKELVKNKLIIEG